MNPSLDNVKVSQAISHAIDVELIVETILLRTAKVMTGPVFDVTKGFDSSLEPYPYDPDKAKELLAEAGYADGFKLVLSTPPEGVEGTTNCRRR